MRLSQIGQRFRRWAPHEHHHVDLEALVPRLTYLFWEATLGCYLACLAGIHIASVLADGGICGCPNVPRSLVQGHIRTDRLKDVWEQRFEAFRDRSWMRHATRCEACTEFPSCKGNSMHLWDTERGGPKMCHHRMLRYSSASEGLRSPRQRIRSSDRVSGRPPIPTAFGGRNPDRADDGIRRRRQAAAPGSTDPGLWVADSGGSWSRRSDLN
jgi:radical SAM protein with 4Fe4S-binding SPASM domain